MIKFKGKYHDDFRKFSSEHIQNESLTITFEHPSSEDQFERKFQDNISPSDKRFGKQEEAFDKVQGETL